MKGKLLIGISVVIGIVITVFNPIVSGIIGMGIWIYLVRMIRKQNNLVSNEKHGSRISKLYLKRLKKLLTIAAFAFIVFFVSAIAHNILYDQPQIEGSISFFIAFLALLIFVLVTIGAMVIFLKGREEQNKSRPAILNIKSD